ncbi:unnamed protein product [Miscanthus lutarioriparius]|uniref:Uncharacterized protein n=1 Tax=Miscanthus lutarioriparius TaxID=422564 RepID=A0A811PHI4_9POAL|nr:unnamed protein product [Miscanthus lutarioriparius]
MDRMTTAHRLFLSPNVPAPRSPSSAYPSPSMSFFGVRFSLRLLNSQGDPLHPRRLCCNDQSNGSESVMASVGKRSFSLYLVRGDPMLNSLVTLFPFQIFHGADNGVLWLPRDFHIIFVTAASDSQVITFFYNSF